MNGFGVIESTIAAFVASIVYISFWYAGALRWKRIDIVDSAWGLGFVYVALVTLLLQPSFGLVQILTMGLVTVWGIRLFLHITTRNMKKSEDPRYTLYRKRWGKAFTRKAYTNIYLVQGALIVFVSTPVIAIMNYPDAHLNPLVITGLAVWIFGILYETIADYQLRSFIKTRQPGQIMQKGLWKLSRHPNYFGEIICWLGASLVALGVGAWWGVAGVLLIAFLIVKISGLPPLEKYYAGNTKYQQYKAKTPALIPFTKH